MSDSVNQGFQLPPEQQAIRDKCFHPLGTFVEFPIEDVETSIPERFEKIVRMYPQRLALKSGERSVSYDALNQAANRIASAIAAQWENKEEPVALVLDQGVDVIAAVLGVLKTGKIYVPLDPSFPRLRNRDDLEDSVPRLILTNERNFSLARELAGNNIGVMNMDQLAPSPLCATPSLRISAGARAYILYTSGSTGKPKGVVQNHRNVLHLVMRYTNRAHITPEDRIALLRSFNVHGGTYLALAALLNGAAILPFDTKEKGLQELARWLAREEVTI